MSDLIPLSEAKKRSGKARQNSRRQAPKPDDEISVAVEKLNKSYAFVLMGGDGWVLRDTQDWDGPPSSSWPSAPSACGSISSDTSTGRPTGSPGSGHCG